MQMAIMSIVIGVSAVLFVQGQILEKRLNDQINTEALFTYFNALVENKTICQSNFLGRRLSTQFRPIDLRDQVDSDVALGAGYSSEGIIIDALNYRTDLGGANGVSKGEVQITLRSQTFNRIIEVTSVDVYFEFAGGRITDCVDGHSTGNLSTIGTCGSSQQFAGLDANGNIQCENAPRGPAGSPGQSGMNSRCSPGAGGSFGYDGSSGVCTNMGLIPLVDTLPGPGGEALKAKLDAARGTL